MAKKSSIPKPVENADPNDPKLTQSLLRRLLWINTERRRLDREARQLMQEESILRDVVFSWLEDRGLTTVKKFGIRVSQVAGRVIVPWEEAYVRECGAEKAQALTEQSPKSVSLKIAEE